MSKQERWHPPRYAIEDIRAIQALAIYAERGGMTDELGQEIRQRRNGGEGKIMVDVVEVVRLVGG